MVDWSKPDWDTTWGNRWYRKAMLLTMVSSVLGTVGFMAAHLISSKILFPLFIIHSLFSHILGFELANRKIENESKESK